MGLEIAGARLTLAMLLITGGHASAEVSTATKTLTQAAGIASAARKSSGPISSFIPVDFSVPRLVVTDKFKIVPLGPDLAKIDFTAYMSSVEHLQKTFTRSIDWPRRDISDSDAMRDMEAEEARFRNRQSFAFSVLTPDGSRERGCVYVSPSTVDGYDAVVRMWVTKDEYDAGFDAKLYGWVTDWMRTDWPFANVAYPGRAIDWGTWDAIVAADRAKPASERNR